MKHFLLGMALVLLVILLAEQSKAQPVALVISQNGGLILLEDTPCPEGIGFTLSTTTKQGVKARGCWQITNNGIVAKWTSVETQPVVFYAPDQIQLITKGAGV